MGLKGYQWKIDNKIVMSFTFKDLTLDVWNDTTKEEYEKFVEYIKVNNFEIVQTNLHNNKIN